MSFNVLGTKPSIWSPKWINGPGDFEKEKHDTWITRRNFHNPLWVFLKRPKFWKLKTCSHLVSDLSWCEGFYCLMPQIEYSYICWRQINVFDYLLPPRSLLGLIHNIHFTYCISFQMPKILPQKHIWGPRISDTETAFYFKVTLANLYIVSKTHLWWKSNLSQTVNYPNLGHYSIFLFPYIGKEKLKIHYMQ